jgi:hypothetical protein
MIGLHASDPSNCLIGKTGFVGSALLRQASFGHRYNRSNIDEIAGKAFSTVICAAAPGSMIEANRSPKQDRAQIHALMDRLATIRCDRFVLISSIAVLADFAGGCDESTRDFQAELAYGRHRRELEAFIEDHFTSHLVVRLPALFGRGLRKNFIFDLRNPVPSMLTGDRHAELVSQLDAPLAAWVKGLYTPDPVSGMLKLDRGALNINPRRSPLELAVEQLGFSATRFHHPETTYQYYEIDRLWRDIAIALDAGLSHIHLVSEPLTAARIHHRLTGREMPQTGARLHREDMHTRHAGLWGKTGPYQYDAAATLDRLAAFHADERAPA